MYTYLNSSLCSYIPCVFNNYIYINVFVMLFIYEMRTKYEIKEQICLREINKYVNK